MSDSAYPAWVADIRRAYTSASASVFLLHGVRDVYAYEGQYLPLHTYLHHVFCGDKHTVYYDIAQGLTFPTPEDEQRFLAFREVLRRKQPDLPLPRDTYQPETAIPLLEEFLFTRDGAAVIIDYADKLAPREEPRMMSFEERRLAATLRRWADDPRLQRRNNFVFLLTETLAEVAEDLYARGRGAYVIGLPLADETERLAYIRHLLQRPELLVRPGAAPPDLTDLLEVSPEVLAKQTNGLTRLQVGAIVRQAVQAREPISNRVITGSKRRQIETEIGDLVAFTMPRYGLEAVAGVDQQKELLLGTARALREGRTEVVPKGILLVGPPGCGKTFTMECFAHDCGIPFLELKNVFNKYVGATESNLEKLFHYLDALAPVFLFIDEFDQSCGKRVASDSDSGVSRRVFAMFNSFLSDESRQGRVMVGAATNRPDLVDASTLRAGRFDLKLPFLLPDDAAREAILRVTLDTLQVQAESLDPSVFAARTAGYTGADLKELVRVAQRRSAFAGRDVVVQDDLEFALEDYVPGGGLQQDHVRYMELLAVAACTSRSLLPEPYRQAVGTGVLQAELEKLRAKLLLG